MQGFGLRVSICHQTHLKVAADLRAWKPFRKVDRIVWVVGV